MEIHDGGSEKLIEGVRLYSTHPGHQGTLDGKPVAPSEWSDGYPVPGSTLVLEYCEHRLNDLEFVPEKGIENKHHWHCTACGLNGASEPCDFAAPDHCKRNPENDAVTHIPVCVCGNEGDAVQHLITTVPTDNGQKHITGCFSCDWTSGGDGEEHAFTDGTGTCTVCGFLPVMSDSNGNLYNEVSYLDAIEAAGSSDSDIEWLQLESHATNEYQGIWRRTLEFDSSDKPVTLKTNGLKLVSLGYDPALTVNGGSLIIEDAAVLEGENGGAGNPATSAIKVTGGNLTFNDTVNATGGPTTAIAAHPLHAFCGTLTI